MIRIFLCAVGLVEKFYVARCQSISGAEVKGGFGGIAKLVVDPTDFLQDFGVVGVCLRECFECAECCGLVPSGALLCGLIEAVGSLFFWPAATGENRECQRNKDEEYFFGVCF